MAVLGFEPVVNSPEDFASKSGRKSPKWESHSSSGHQSADDEWGR